ncbi:hypothetical protein EQG49_05415 [Periweissella cryptocerci]|uniref:Uncharacterized protein n=1 Tax=Periweissella cryptocerci TaxID=2506420 RepID=A0A4P6YTC9_9LACO|nr:hypothetical protein [Periweissella cryptocerci]QBO35936.1 hypothetical protein EQG49_05415 [Periweissella cryptocerci]
MKNEKTEWTKTWEAATSFEGEHHYKANRKDDEDSTWQQEWNNKPSDEAIKANSAEAEWENAWQNASTAEPANHHYKTNHKDDEDAAWQQEWNNKPSDEVIKAKGDEAKWENAWKESATAAGANHHYKSNHKDGEESDWEKAWNQKLDA